MARKLRNSPTFFRNVVRPLESAADRRGHVNRTRAAGAGGLLGAVVGSFLGPAGAAVGGGLGALIGAGIGDQQDGRG